MANHNTLKELPQDFVGYFGTRGCAGHDLVVLDGYRELSDIDICDWGVEFDRDWIMMQLSTSSFKCFWWKNADVTIVGYPKSLDDERPGSKSLFIVKGNHTQDYEYLITKMKQYSWVYEIFEKLADKYLKD